MKLLPFAIAAVIGLLLTALIGGCGRSVAPPPATRTGPTTLEQAGAAPNVAAADFSFTTLDGTTIKLSDLRGKPVVLNFWASWCHFCAQEAPDLEALYRQYRPQGLEVLGVGTDDLDAIRKKAQELKLTYPVGSNAAAASVYRVSSIPHTFFINRKGLIVASILGAQPKSDLEAAVKRIL